MAHNVSQSPKRAHKQWDSGRTPTANECEKSALESRMEHEMALTDALIKALKAQGGLRYSKADGNGLLLDVTPSRSQILGISLSAEWQAGEGRHLGRYPEVSLKEARAERDKYAAMVAAGQISIHRKRNLRERDCLNDPDRQGICRALLHRASVRETGKTRSTSGAISTKKSIPRLGQQAA